LKWSERSGGVENGIGHVVAGVDRHPLAIQIVDVVGADRLERDYSLDDRRDGDHGEHLRETGLEHAVVAPRVKRVDDAVFLQADCFVGRLRTPREGDLARVDRLDVVERPITTDHGLDTNEHRRDFLVRQLPLLSEQDLQGGFVDVRGGQGSLHGSLLWVVILCLLVEKRTLR
jgi:hypothetical protein